MIDVAAGNSRLSYLVAYIKKDTIFCKKSVTNREKYGKLIVIYCAQTYKM